MYKIQIVDLSLVRNHGCTVESICLSFAYDYSSSNNPFTCSVGRQFLKTWKGVWNYKTLEGILFIKYATVKTTSPHKYIGTLVAKSNARATSNRCLFFLSATPLYWGVSIQELWWIIPFSRKKNCQDHVKILFLHYHLYVNRNWVCTIL